MKTGIETGAYFGDRLTDEGLAQAKAHGYDCLDYQFLADTNWEGYALQGQAFDAFFREEARRVQAAGLEICQTHGPWRYPPQDATPQDRRERFEKMSRALHATALLGSPCMVIHPIMPFGVQLNPDPKDFWALNLEYYRRLTSIARQEGVILCLENMPFPNLTLSRPDEIFALVKEIDDAFFRICLDTGHCAVCGVSPATAVRRMSPWIQTLHVHDNDGIRDLHQIPYEGVIDWADFARALSETHWNGVLSLEAGVSRGQKPAWLLDQQRRSLAQIAASLAGNF